MRGFVWGSVVAAAAVGCSSPPFAPADPFAPSVRRDLAGCEYRTTGTPRPSTTGAQVLEWSRLTRYDDEGRPVLDRYEDRDDAGGSYVEEIVSTWSGACRERSTGRSENGRVEPPIVSEWETITICDDHEQPIDIRTTSTTVQGESAEPGTWSSSVGLRENAYDGDHLVEVVYVDEDGVGSGYLERLEWDGDHLVRVVGTEVVNGFTAEVLGEPASDGVLLTERTWTWDGDRLLEARIDEEFPSASRYTTTNVYDGRTWLGSDFTAEPSGGGEVFYASSSRWIYDDEGDFPVGHRSVPDEGDPSEVTIEVTCD